MQRDQKNRRKHRRRTGCQHQNSQRGHQGQKRIPDAIFKIDKPDPQHDAKQCHGHRGIVRTKHAGQQTDEHNGKGHDQHRTHGHSGPIVQLILLCIAGCNFPFEDGRVHLQCIIKLHLHRQVPFPSPSARQVYPHNTGTSQNLCRNCAIGHKTAAKCFRNLSLVRQGRSR